MSKVLVDRELLERAMYANDGKELIAANRELRAILAQPAEVEGVELVPFWVLFDATTPEPLIKKHMPEGVLAFFDNEEDARRAKALHPGTDYKRAPYVRAAALSAVTAERDRLREEMARAEQFNKSLNDENTRLFADYCAADKEAVTLRAEVEALRVALLGIASVNPAERGIEWAKAYASDGLKGAGSELYARWLDTFKEAEALRKDAERWRYVSLQGDDMHWLNLLRVDLDDFGGNINAAVDALIDGEAPAMAAKEV